ncbi:MAG: Gfo/Idh/MocA family protein [Anaerolineae bacterium]
MLRLGVIGVGTFGINHLRAFDQLQREGKAELAAAADINETLLAERQSAYGFHAYTDYEQMFAREHLDAVSVVTPDYLHRRPVLAALESGLHVLVEKPMDVSVEGCREMLAAARRSARLLQVDFHKRYDPYHRRLRQAVQAGEYGRILYGHGYMEDKIVVPRDWFPKWAGKSSPAWFLGVHLYDLVRWVMGAEAVRVAATGAKHKLLSLGIDTYDAVCARVEFDNGACVSFDTSWVLPEGFEAMVNQGLRLTGTEGVAEVDTQDRGARAVSTRDGQQTWNMGFLSEDTAPDGRALFRGYGIESIADFVQNVSHLQNGGCLADLTGRLADARDGLEATKIAVAVHESAEHGGEWVALGPEAA